MIAFLPGSTEIWVILIIALLLFGHRIPSMARSLGGGIVEFKKGLRGDPEDSEKLAAPTNSNSSEDASSSSSDS